MKTSQRIGNGLMRWAGLLSAVLWGQAIHASDVVIPVSANANLVGSFGSTVESSFDGTGLSSFPSLTASHDRTIPDNSFVVVGESLIVDF